MSGRRGVSSGLLALGLGLGLAGCSETTDEPAPLLVVDVDAPALGFVKDPEGATLLVTTSTGPVGIYGSLPLRLTNLTNGEHVTVGASADCPECSALTTSRDVGDLDGDGADDLAVISCSDLLVYLSDGGAWTLAGSLSLSTWSGPVWAGLHALGDGRLLVARVTDADSYELAECSVSAEAGLVVTRTTPLEHFGSQLLDLSTDTDGAPTRLALVGNSRVSILEGPGWTPAALPRPPGDLAGYAADRWSLSDALALDVTGDGRRELIACRDECYGDEVLACFDLGTGARHWTWRGWDVNCSRDSYVDRTVHRLVDLDGDGAPEVLFAPQRTLETWLDLRVLSGRTGVELGRLDRLQGRRLTSIAVSDDGRLVALHLGRWHAEREDLEDTTARVVVHAATDLPALWTGP